MKKATFVLMTVLAALVLGGCVLGSVQSMSAVRIQCTVVSAATGQPIEGARVEVAFDPANPDSRRVPSVVFVTDSAGVCQVDIPKRSMWISGSDAFVGGYLRRLVVTAPGYEDSGLSEGFEKGLLGQISERTFQLRPKRVGAAAKEPNQSLEPTTLLGTSAAEQPLVPSRVVAHL